MTRKEFFKPSVIILQSKFSGGFVSFFLTDVGGNGD